MKISFVFFSLLLSIFAFGCAQKTKQVPRDIASIEAAGGMEGIWFLQGSSDVRGPYNGELEFRKSHDGTYDVVRVATYINYFFDGLKVQEVWTGKAVVSGGIVTISYELRQGDFIFRMNGQRREETSFKNPVTVISRLSVAPAGLTTKFTDKKDSNYSEWITTRRALESKPLWADLRRFEEAKSPEMSRENKSKSPRLIVDPTDYEFYKKARDTIRITNKITDNINITEAVVKRNAYGPSLKEKATGYDLNIVENHFNQAHLIVASRVTEDGKFISFVNDKDAGFSTGMYLASQAMRYKATGREDALENVKRALRGLLNLIEISAEENVLAKSMSLSEGESLPTGWKMGAGRFQNFIWLGGADRETLIGMTQGLLWAKMVLPETELDLLAQTKEKVGQLVGRKLDGLSSEDKNILSGLAAVWSGDLRNLEAFKPLIPMAKHFSLNGAADWKASSNSTLNKINYTLVNDLLGLREARDQWRERLINDWITYEPVQRHLSTLAAYGFSFRHQVKGSRFIASSSDQKFDKSLQEAVWGLKEIPYPRPSLQVKIDHSLSRNKGLYSYPPFELQAFSSKFLWSEPAFEYQVAHEKGVENPGVDYLYAYWLARYSGVESIQ